MESAWIGPEDERWYSFLARCVHDIYHTPEYSRVTALHDGGVPIAFWSCRDGKEMLVPLLERLIPGRPGNFDAASPYGYAGALWLGEEEEPRAQCQHWDTFLEQAKARGWVSIFLRTHPFLPSRVSANYLPGQVHTHGLTYSAGLSPDSPMYWQQISKQSRRWIRRLREASLEIKMNAWDTYPDFIEIYLQTMRRRDSPAYYHFSPRYFHELREQLGSSVHLGSVIDRRGKMIAGSLYLHCNGIVQAHLGGVHDEAVRHNPMRLLDFESALYFQRLGSTILHLGGGLGGEDDNLAQYKRSMAGRTHPYHTARVILHPELYDKFSEGAETSFFPAYRQMA